MKKITVFIVLILVALSLTACIQPSEEASGPCDEHNWIYVDEKNSKICSNCGAFEGIEINEQNWDDALAEESFNNVTISFTFVAEKIVDNSGYYIDATEGMKTVQLFKVDGNKVYRKIDVYAPDGEYLESESFYFTCTGVEAQMQRKMFYDIFAALLADYDNFVYNDEKFIYETPSEINVDVSDSVGEETMSVIETIKNAKVKFGSNGKLEYFESYHTESMYEKGDLLGSISGKMILTYSNYGTTIIE